MKGDVDGSVGALADSLMKITHAEVRVNVIYRAVGAITESRCASRRGFERDHHRIPRAGRTSTPAKLAEQEKVDIRHYNIIYDAIEDVRKALEGLLTPLKEEETATVEVRETFKVPKIGTVAGCYVQDGKIRRGNKVRLIRDGMVVFDGTDRLAEAIQGRRARSRDGFRVRHRP